MLSLLLALSAPVQAQDCNVRQAQADLKAATPTSVPAAYSALAECDAGAAKKAAPDALEKVLAGKEGNAVLKTAVQVGADAAALEYIEGLQSDERSKAVASLGTACNASEHVADFLTATAESKGDAFWTERWYRSLAECRNPGVQELLQSEIDKPVSDQTRFFGVLEVYSRNLGADALPTLKRLLGELENEEELTYVVNAFADAAQVGSLEGVNAETSGKAAAIIVEMAPQLPPKAVEQARTTLLSLGAEAEANKLAGVRYQDRMVDGQLRYGVVVVETATCKKGDTQIGVHMGVLTESGAAWPDQVAESVDAASYGWDYELAGSRKCKGTSENTVFLSAQPVEDDAALQAFWDEQRQKVIRAAQGPVTEISEETELKLQ
ncbi:MAG: hypothetical protein VX899_10955 [Myxococcota bacterium]|nr:hypothetical protein [Myxococcota bacterium]